jgi:GNAT superfamily N-acetyltransferase
MISALVFRQPNAADAPTIAVLLTQLGYPANTTEIADRLLRLIDHTHAIILVAELDGNVVGVITAHTFPSIHATTPAAWITTLVVDENCRGQNIGRELVARAERWVVARGATKISVTSALRRNDAHAFYEAIGYARSGVRLTKEF